jgi:hypothetical protein
MAELKKALIRTMHQEGGGGPSIITPDLCTDVRLAVPKRKAARLIGAIARKAQEQKKANALAKQGLEDGTKKSRGEKVQGGVDRGCGAWHDQGVSLTDVSCVVDVQGRRGWRRRA